MAVAGRQSSHEGKRVFKVTKLRTSKPKICKAGKNSKQSETWPLIRLSVSEIDSHLDFRIPEVGADGRAEAEEELRRHIALYTQPVLKVKMRLIYGRAPSSNNNEWMKKKIREACGCQTATDDAEASGTSGDKPPDEPPTQNEPALDPSTPRHSQRLATKPKVTFAYDDDEADAEADTDADAVAPADANPGALEPEDAMGEMAASGADRAINRNLLETYNIYMARERIGAPSAVIHRPQANFDDVIMPLNTMDFQGGPAVNDMGMVAMPLDINMEPSELSFASTSSQIHYGNQATEHAATLTGEAARLGICLSMLAPDMDSLSYAPPAHSIPLQGAAELTTLDQPNYFITDMFEML